ncbi:hypothetical protein [Anaeromicropila herbilytica]|uniref:Uncharacterized protein n=1 Tax=Anaeromicropila herbilytica TaxID=2785025 RepID=A0A7R7ICV0_9FIRM|nr:hypothetical protein [Anaeromicropila herbilytica]BCN30246.1 hypothetical protein bsdtb5_15410 [Anaeromicropila herbilytica]
MDSFSKIVAIIISILLLFVAPLMYLTQKQDMISQVYVSNETASLVDSIRNTGYLSSEMYTAFLRKISATNVSYQISIVHAHKLVEPLFDDVTASYTDEYVSYYENTYDEDIRKALEENGEYSFSKGDYITIKVVNQSETLGTKLQKMIYRANIPKEQIVVTYGGLIRSETN